MSRAEVGHRTRFAQRFASEAELANAVGTFGSWHQVVKVALAREQPEVDSGDVDNEPLPADVHRVIVADPQGSTRHLHPWRQPAAEARTMGRPQGG